MIKTGRTLTYVSMDDAQRLRWSLPVTWKEPAQEQLCLKHWMIIICFIYGE